MPHARCNLRRSTPCLLVLACALVLPTRATMAGEAELAKAIEELLADSKLSKADVGVHVVSTATGRVIYSRNARRSFIAASNEKLVTAAAALEELGQGYEFVTAIYAQGKLKDGLLRGDLVLRGGGDPTLGGRYDEEDALTIFRRWARVLSAKGLQRVAGDVVADAGFFDRVYRHPNWGDYPAWKWHYGPASALSINDNCVTITVKPGAAPGKLAVVSIKPASAPVELRVRCKTATKRHAIWFDREAGSSAIKVGGHVRKGTSGYSHHVTVPNPPLYAAATLKEALEAEGIRVDGSARLIVDGEAIAREADELFVRRTALVPVLRMMVKRSHNHYAEQVLKTIGAEASGVGSWQAGLRRAGLMLRDMGLADGQFNLDDGSGLSRGNRLPPAQLGGLLVRMRRSEHGAVFASLLAVAGQDGTLKRRLQEAPYGGNVRAKTGYLNGVGALSGYARAVNGTEVAFSILINDSQNPPGTYSMREAVDDICRAIVDHAG